ncbi:MAG TPA: TolC family protein [Bdellovibrionota bacterium]|nr:TolC family protein [Bdellovibrionota bacterium]
MTKLIVILIGMTAGLNVAHAALPMPALSFAEVWSKVATHSKMQKAGALETEAASTANDRAARHVWPHLSLDARIFATQDPAMSFFSRLAQRSVTMNDFAPEALNYPGRATYERVTLGIDWPIYEGGSRSALSDFQTTLLDSKRLENRAVQVAEYAKTAELYGTLLIAKEREDTVAPVRDLLGSTISNYAIGIKANPVGHSGLLGMQALRNRIDGELTANTAKKTTAARALAILAEGLPDRFRPKDQGFHEFADGVFKRGPRTDSFAVQAEETASRGMDNLTRAEKAKFLPKIAIFSEGYLAGGDRSSSTGYTAGVYLQWDLFNAQNFGSIREASLRGNAAESRADAKRQQERLEADQLSEALGATRAAIDLASRSIVIMEQQTEISRKLFKNGMINALQFTEVLSRRIDAILSRSEAQEQYLSMLSRLMTMYPLQLGPVQGE